VKPTKEDAGMILKLVEMIYSTEDLKKGMWWVTDEPSVKYDEFKKKYPVGSEGYRNFMNVGMFYELLGVLVYYGVLNEDLVFDLFATMWSKAEPIVKGIQKEKGRDFFENYEWLATKKTKWLKTRPPKFPEGK
jgi:hypothetical protein